MEHWPTGSGARRRCISIAEMVGKLRAAMDAKAALDPDFVIMARCDLGGVPGAGFAEIIERCQAYKAEAQVDVVCPNGLRSWEEIQEAIRLIFGRRRVLGVSPAMAHSGRAASARHGGEISSGLRKI